MLTTVKFKKMLPEAQIPRAQRDGDVGLDVYALEDVELVTHRVTKVRTGIQLADTQSNYPFYLKVEGRSGMAQKGIIPVGGIIDATYRGEIIVMLVNLGSHGTPFDAYQLKAGERIAQLIAYPVYTQGINLVVEEADTVTQTVRNDNGFGSSGA